MKLTIIFPVLLLSLAFPIARSAEGEDVLKDLNIDEICKTENCKNTVKSIKEGHKYRRPALFAEKVLLQVQEEYGRTAVTLREQMEEDSTPIEIKKALSHCLKLYLDIAHQLRGAYLAIKTGKFGPQATEFGPMTASFPAICEAGLKRAESSGEKLGLYLNANNLNELTDLAKALEAIIKYAADHKVKGGASTKADAGSGSESGH